MKKKVLITGITGFVGSHLTELLLSRHGYDIYGTARPRSNRENIEHLQNKIKIFSADILDSHSIYELIKKVRPDYIFHLAAQSFVPASWTSPETTMEVNVIGTVHLFEAVRSLNINPVIQIACCYDNKTRAFTNRGLKTYKELTNKDLVLSINPKTRTVEYKKVKKVIISQYQGKMFHFESKSCDLMVTSNHKILVKKAKSNEIRFVQADKLTGRNLLPLGKINSDKKHFPEEMYYLIGLFIGGGYIVPSKKVLKWSGLSHGEDIKHRNNKGQFLKMNKKSQKEYISQRAFLAIPKRDKARKKAGLFLEKLGIKYSGYEKELYFIPPLKLLKILQQCGRGAKNKKIPKFLLDSNIKYLQELFEGLIDADGSYRKRRFSYSTSSAKLAENMIELCSKIGKWISITKAEPGSSKIGNRKIKSSEAYSLSISEGEKILTKTSDTNKKIVNYKGTIWCVEVEDNHNLLVERNGKISFCGNSSEEYGLVKKNEVPVDEDGPFRPLSPYGVSKVAMDLLGFQYYRSYGMKIIRTRAFNHTGPRRAETFVCSSFAKQIAEIEKGLKDPVIHVGNLEAKRDFTDVRDIVRAYVLAVQKCNPGEAYVIASGRARKISRVLEMLTKLSKVRVSVQQDPERMRPSDVPILQGDSSKFRRKTGWEPKIPFKKTLKDILDYWRERV